jgi:2,3-diketo-5-methylthio-1-phosphopentane phosphatase
MDNMPGSTSDNKKILFVFDFDHTILRDNSDYEILPLISDKGNADLQPLYKVRKNWANYMQEVYKKMKEENVNISQVKEIVENLPFNPGYEELFELIKSNKDKFEALIISGANTLFLEWVLQRRGLTGLFPIYFSNWAEPDENLVIKIRPHHSHDCNTCDESQCKKLILSSYLENSNKCEQYSKFIYVGDGENDYCVATLLREGDLLFPRANFPLDKKLHQKGFIENMKCHVHIWDDGYKIIEEVKKLI